METLEHWWNGRPDAVARQDIFLRFNPAGLWEVEFRTQGTSRYREYATEAGAREVSAGLRAQGDWKRLDTATSVDA